MNRYLSRLVFGFYLAAGLAVGGGCAMLPGDQAAEGLRLKEPDAKFMKQVERDSFPRADTVSAGRR